MYKKGQDRGGEKWRQGERKIEHLPKSLSKNECSVPGSSARNCCSWSAISDSMKQLVSTAKKLNIFSALAQAPMVVLQRKKQSKAKQKAHIIAKLCSKELRGEYFTIDARAFKHLQLSD